VSHQGRIRCNCTVKTVKANMESPQSFVIADSSILLQENCSACQLK